VPDADDDEQLSLPIDPYELQDAVCACRCGCLMPLMGAEKDICGYCNLGIHTL